MKKPHEQPIDLHRPPRVDLPFSDKQLQSEPEGSRGMKIENDCQASCPSKAIRPLALKLNNFLLWAGAGCVHPYFSVYFIHYTGASEKEFGRLMSMAAVLGTILNLTLSSLSDRYRAHRLIYSLSLACTYLAIALLLVPIISSGLNGSSAAEGPNSSSSSDIRSATLPTLAVDEFALIDSMAASETGEVVQVESSLESVGENLSTPLHWVYIIRVCLAIGSLGLAINMNFSESFTTNIGQSHSESGGKESYCSIRFFGALGWCLMSLVLSLVDERSLNLPYLFVPWLLFTCLFGLTTLLALVWPDKRPFSLAAETSELQLRTKMDIEVGLVGDKRASRVSFGRQLAMSTFKLRNKFEWRSKAPVFIGVRRVSSDLSSELCCNNKTQTPRRSSIAALGTSHVIEQYELRPATSEANGVAVLRRWSNKQNVNGMADPDDETTNDVSHFKQVTKIKPASSAKEIELTELTNRPMRTTSTKTKSISFKLYLKIIELIGRRNKNMPRFLVLYAIVGFVVAMNWYFLFPYLDELNPDKFSRLGPYVMMSGYLSEMLFYFLSPRIPFKVRPSVGLSCILLVFAVRYTTYLTFCLWPDADLWPMEMIIVVELLQSLTVGWFDCILNESAMEFALEAEHCLPKLIELELIDDCQSETVEMVKSSVKLSLVGVSACFYDGIGVALGSLAGGWLIVDYGYSVLWPVSAAISLAVALGNLLLEWTLFKDYKSGDRGNRSPNKLGQ